MLANQWFRSLADDRRHRSRVLADRSTNLDRELNKQDIKDILVSVA